MIYVANVNEEDIALGNNKYTEMVREYAKTIMLNSLL